jgi:hypothetical protein
MGCWVIGALLGENRVIGVCTRPCASRMALSLNRTVQWLRLARTSSNAATRATTSPAGPSARVTRVARCGSPCDATRLSRGWPSTDTSICPPERSRRIHLPEPTDRSAVFHYPILPDQTPTRHVGCYRYRQWILPEASPFSLRQRAASRAQSSFPFRVSEAEFPVA